MDGAPCLAHAWPALPVGPIHVKQPACLPLLPLQLLEKEVPAKFVNAVQQVVDLGVKLLHDMAGKAQFYRDRLAQVSGSWLSLRCKESGWCLVCWACWLCESGLSIAW